MLLLVLLPTLATAATISVNTFTDEIGPTGTTGTGCSIREAVHAANNNTNFGGCVGVGGYGTETINLPNGTYTLKQFDGSQFSWDTPDESNNLMNDIDIRSPMSIVGSTNPWDVIITRNLTAPAFDDQFFEIYGTTVTLQGITFTDAAPFHSSAIRGGGAMYTELSDVTIDNCLFYANNGANQGGGFFQRQGNVVVQRSAFYNNTPGTTGVGGAVYAIGFFPNTTRIYNSTFDGNVAGGRGGALYGDTGSDIRVFNSTITNNQSGTYYITNDDYGGGAANISISNSVVSGNLWFSGNANQFQTPDDCHFCGSLGYNLVGSSSGFSPLATDTIASADLDPLTPATPPFTTTPARQPMFGGNVRNAGDPLGCRDVNGALLLTDQHGTKRHQHDACDRGAIEYDETNWADVALSVSRTPAAVNAGQNVTFTTTVTVNDIEGTAAGNVLLSFDQPTTVSSATWSAGGPATNCTTGPPVSCALSRTNFSTVTITAVVSTLNGGTLNATATHTIPDPLAGDDVGTAAVTVTGLSDLSAGISSSDTAIQDDAYTFTVSATNGGPSPATNVSATVTLPANVEYASSTGSCSSVGQVVTCALGSLAASNGTSVDLTVTPRVGATGNIVVSVDSSETDNTPGNDGAQLGLVMTTRADLATTSYHSAAPVQDVSYTRTFQIDNNGPTTASPTTATILLPSNITYSGYTASAGSCTLLASPARLSCALGSMEPGKTTTVDVTVVPRAGASGDFVLTPSAPQNDPTPGNDVNTFTLSPSTEADLITSSSHASPPVQDAPYTRTFVVYNDGRSTTTSTTATITLPSGVDTISSTITAPLASGSCSIAGSTLTCNLGSLADNEQATIAVTVTPRASASGSFVLTAVAPEDDPNGANNSDSFNISAGASSDLVTSSSSADTAIQDAPYTRTFTVDNAGPTTTSSTTMTITLPSNVTFVSSTGSCSLAGATLTCTIGSLAAGLSGSVDVTIIPRAGASGSFVVGATAPQPDPTPANNDDGSFVLGATTSADLSVTSSSTDTPFQDAAYDRTFTVHNAGPTTTSSTTLTIDLPDNVDYTGATGNCSLTGATLTCTLGSLQAGQDGSVVVTVVPRAGASGSFDAAADAPENDPTAGNDTDSFTLTATVAADLDASSSSTYTPVQDSPYVRSFVVTNDGPAATSSTTATITLPNGVDYVSATGASCMKSGATLTCDLGAINAGNFGSVTVTIIPRAGANGAFTLTASAPEADPTPGNNTDSFTLTTTQVADLSAALDVSSGAVVGGQVTITLTVTNAGPSTTSETTGSLTLPNGASLVSSSIAAPASSGSCNVGPNGVVTCPMGPLAATESGTATMIITVSAAGVSDIPYAATSPARDPATATGSGSVGFSPSYVADLAVTAGPPLTASAGGTVDATFTVTNNGPSPVSAAALSFEGAGFRVIAADAGRDCTDTACDLGAIASGATALVTVTVMPLALGSFGITATEVSGAEDQIPANDSATQALSVTTVADGFDVGTGTGGAAGSNNRALDDLTVKSRKGAGACGSAEPTWLAALCVLLLLRRRAARR